jgi:hypothetical protein
MYTSIMIRTQIYLPEEELKDLRKTARAKRQSMAALARGFIRRGLEEEQAASGHGQAVMKTLAGLKIAGGPRDLSQNLDDYLYGSKQ